MGKKKRHKHEPAASEPAAPLPESVAELIAESLQLPALAGGSESFGLIFRLMRKIDPLGGVRELTELDDILTYFSTETPHDFTIKAGLLLRQRNGGTYLVAQCFLGDGGNLGCDPYGRPYGRIFRTLKFDPGLLDLFGRDDLIIFT
jgi:hypothetical protein